MRDLYSAQSPGEADEIFQKDDVFEDGSDRVART